MFQSASYVTRAVLIAAIVLSPLVADAKPYKAAEIFTNDSELYGKYVFRMRAAEGSGIISNFFLWKDGSELEGVAWEEVDIEVFGQNNADSWQSNVITGLDTRVTSEQVHNAGASLADAYHTYSIEWTPGRVRWLVDGQVVRDTQGGQASELISPAQARFNFWPPNIPAWVGPWDDSILPVHMFVNWVEYHSWNGSGFDFQWRDDFNSFDTGRWGKADWTFAENRADFAPANAVTVNGFLVLSMTREGQEGFDGTPPVDNDDNDNDNGNGNDDVGSNMIVVRASGTTGTESITLRVGDIDLQSWTLSTGFLDFTASTDLQGDISVAFTNDNGDADVQIDYIMVNGETRQAEDQSENTGVWANGQCGGGSNSEWLHCNGFISFGSVSGDPSPSDPPPDSPDSGDCPVLSGGQSGNFDTSGAYCFRTQDTISGWGVSNFSGRTISVTVNGSGASVTTPGAPLPTKGSSDFYVFEASAGEAPWASVYWW